MYTLNYLFSCLLITIVCCKECYWNSTNNYKYFSTKTPYDDVRGDIRAETPLEGCSPVGVWAMIRHGTRLPTAGERGKLKKAMKLKDLIISNYHKGRGEMCAQDITDLAKWTWNSTYDKSAAYLTNEGVWELFHLGQRVREKFSPLLDDLDEFQFRSTATQRTEESAKAFVQGLENMTFTVEEALENDDVLEPYNNCDKYDEELKESDDLLDQERDKFEETKEYQQLLTNTRQRLGIANLPWKRISGLYKLCQYSRAYTKDRKHAWCSVFLDEDLPTLEYIKDLKHRYGNKPPVISKLGAVTLKDLYENLEAAVNGSKRFTGYFSHDTMMEILFTTLGLFHDYPDINGSRMNLERKWRTSLIAPFASNFIVVLNKCTENNSTSHKVQVFVNEMLVPFCGERACDWTEFKEKLQPFTRSNLDFCNT